MSAICGIIGPAGSVDVDGDLAPVLAALHGVAPDGAGVWTGEVGGLSVALGARLRHRTPEDERGHQPGTGPLVVQGGLVVAADVVLDNRRSLCAQLGVPDDPDRTDTDVVAAAYRRWGPALAEHLRGDVALAIADRARGGVLLARDHRGNRPLQVHARAGVTRLATTALALTASPAIDREPDFETVRQYLGGGLLHERSWIEGVAPVPPATARWIDASGTRQRRYWTLTYDPDRSGSFGDHVARVRHALERATWSMVDRRRGTAGVSLSGGLDSTAVAAIAAAHLHPEAINAYTSAPPAGWAGPSTRKEADERHLVEALAHRHPNICAAHLDTVARPLLAVHDDIFRAGGIPLANAGNASWMIPMFRRAGGDSVTILLTGANGNYGFSADDDRWGADLLLAGRPIRACREVWAEARRTGRPMTGVMRHHVLRPLLPEGVRAWRRRHGDDTSADDHVRRATMLRSQLSAASEPGRRSISSRTRPSPPNTRCHAVALMPGRPSMRVDTSDSTLGRQTAVGDDGGDAWPPRWERGAVPTKLPGGARTAALVQATHDAALITVPGVGRFLARRDQPITVDGEPGATDDDLRCFLDGPVATASLLLRKRFTLRGAAVGIRGRAVAVIGGPAEGASTLAALLGRRGHPLLADRVVLLTPEGQVRPTDHGLRLWPDAIEACGFADAPEWPAQPVRPGLDVRKVGGFSSAPGPMPLAAVVVAGRRAGAEAQLEPMRGADGLTAVAPKIWHRRLVDALSLEPAAFEWLAAALSGVSVLRLDAPNGLRRLPAVADLIDAAVPR